MRTDARADCAVAGFITKAGVQVARPLGASALLSPSRAECRMHESELCIPISTTRNACRYPAWRLCDSFATDRITIVVNHPRGIRSSPCRDL